MKKVIIAGILIVAVSVAFTATRLSLSQNDTTVDVYNKPYPVPFGDWVVTYLSVTYKGANDELGINYISRSTLPNGRMRFYIGGFYKDTPRGRDWYNKSVPLIRSEIKQLCEMWTAQGYLISIDDFDFSGILSIAQTQKSEGEYRVYQPTTTTGYVYLLNTKTGDTWRQVLYTDINTVGWVYMGKEPPADWDEWVAEEVRKARTAKPNSKVEQKPQKRADDLLDLPSLR